MMKAKDFILERLNKLANTFPEIKLRYELSRNTGTHIIEVIPLHVYESNEDYLMAEDAFEEEFNSLYPSEEIIFISENSLTEVKNPEYEITYSKMNFDLGFEEPALITSGYNSTYVEITENKNNYALAA